MKKSFRISITAALVAMFGISACTTSPKSDSASTTPSATQTRDVAAATQSEGLSDELMESHFQSILSSNQPDRDAIDYIGRLYVLLIETNKSINQFSEDLDAQLLLKNANPSLPSKELLEYPTYQRLMKMWKLKDQYIAEISYFYFRSLQMRFERDSQNHHTPAALQARKLVRNVEVYLKNSVDSTRVELQELMEHLGWVFQAFVKQARADFRAKRNGVTQPLTPADSNMSFAGALFQSPELLYAYIRQHKVAEVPVLTAQEQLERRSFLNYIEKELDQLPDTLSADREPQALQDNTCAAGKRLCVSPGETGNIIGSLLPPGYWAFTFDDGPAAKSTSDMMDLVHGYSDSVNPIGKATFFQLAKNAHLYPQWIKKAFDYGFPVENHSYDHADLHSPKTNLKYEINQANTDLLTEYHKVDPNYVIQYFRCPYGSCYAPKVPVARQMISDQGQIHTYWRIDSLDWKLLNGPKIADLVEKQIQLLDHGVILMHDIHPTTVDAMKIILPWLKDQNNNHGKKYKMITIPEVVDLINNPKSAQ